jgi:hypothetical protein
MNQFKTLPHNECTELKELGYPQGLTERVFVTGDDRPRLMFRESVSPDRVIVCDAPDIDELLKQLPENTRIQYRFHVVHVTNKRYPKEGGEAMTMLRSMAKFWKNLKKNGLTYNVVE